VAFRPDIRVPVHASQGEDGEGGTMRRIDAISAQARGPA
jgi:hypothetical protein